jgi:fatty-acyl-CoA synthase
MAFLLIRPGSETPTAESLREFCDGRIAHYKIPRYVEVIEEFPLTVTGKVRKVELRDQARERVGSGRSEPNPGNPMISAG